MSEVNNWISVIQEFGSNFRLKSEGCQNLKIENLEDADKSRNYYRDNTRLAYITIIPDTPTLQDQS